MRGIQFWLALLAAFPVVACAEELPDARESTSSAPQKVLFVGNSFTYYNNSLQPLLATSPEGLEYTAGLDADVAAYLQQAAWQSVSDYKKRVSN